MVQFCYLRLYILALIMFLVVGRNGLQGLKNGLKLRPTTRYTDIQQPDKYKTDSDQIVKVPRKATLE